MRLEPDGRSGTDCEVEEMICRVCEKYKTCDNPYCGDSSMIYCGEYEKSKQTNADRIRAMTDEELAQVLRNPCDIADHGPTGWCKERNCGYQCALEWLQQESDGE